MHISVICNFTCSHIICHAEMAEGVHIAQCRGILGILEAQPVCHHPVAGTDGVHVFGKVGGQNPKGLSACMNSNNSNETNGKTNKVIV